MAYLTVRSKGEKAHSYFDLERERVVLGRQEDCEFHCDDKQLSRRHCMFVREDGTWYIEDLGSANGTRVNAETISGRRQLDERDVVKVGSRRLTFHRGRRKDRVRKPIDLGADALAGGGTVPTREVEINDPPEAVPCDHCPAWFSVAHRLPGDRMDCPQCGKASIVPSLVG